MTDELGKMPRPRTEEPEHAPGGPDSADNPAYGETFDDSVTPELRPETNPAARDVPDEVAELDDKSQEPDDGSDTPEPPA